MSKQSKPKKPAPASNTRLDFAQKPSRWPAG